MTEAEQIVRRYGEALRRIANPTEQKPWCEDFAMCDHDGCHASKRAIEIAEAALDLTNVAWPPRSVR